MDQSVDAVFKAIRCAWGWR